MSNIMKLIVSLIVAGCLTLGLVIFCVNFTVLNKAEVDTYSDNRNQHYCPYCGELINKETRNEYR